MIKNIFDLYERVNESFLVEALANFKYTIPKEKPQLLFDFYMLVGLPIYNIQTNYVHDKEYDKDVNLVDLTEESQDELIGYLKPHLLEKVMFSVCAEFRHVLDRNKFDKMVQVLGNEKFLKEYVKNYKVASSGYREVLDRSKSKRFEKDSDSYLNSYLSVKSTKIPIKDFIEIAQKAFLDLSWASSYGGTAWAGICKGWTMLNDASTKNEKVIAIDHIFDLQHNTDTVFNKIVSYNINGYSWIKDALNKKRDAKNLFDFWDDISSPLRELAPRVIKAGANQSLEMYLKKTGIIPNDDFDVLDSGKKSENGKMIPTKWNELLSDISISKDPEKSKKRILKFDINAQDNVGACLLSQTIRYYGLDYLKFILTLPDLDVNLKNYKGKTAIEYVNYPNPTYDVKRKLDMLTDFINGGGKPAEVKDKEPTKKIMLQFGTEVPENWNKFLPISVNPEHVTNLLKYDLNALDNNGVTALHYATYKNLIGSVRWMLENIDGIDISKKDKHGNTCKKIADIYNFKEIYNILDQYGKEPSKEKIKFGDKVPLYWTGYVQYAPIDLGTVKKDLEIYDPNKKDVNGYTALIIAVRDNKQTFLKNLLTFDGVDLSIKDGHGYTAMDYAVEKGNNNAINLLNEYKQTPIDTSSDDKSKPLNQNFHDIGAHEWEDIMAQEPDSENVVAKYNYNGHDKKGYSLLLYSIINNKLPLFELLLKQEDIVINDFFYGAKLSLLQIAVIYKRFDMVKILRNHPWAQVDYKDKLGKTALDYAIDGNDIAIQKLLENLNKVPKDTPSDMNSGTLLWKKLMDNVEIQYILKQQYDVNQLDRDGWSLIASSIVHNNIPVFSALINLPNVDLTNTSASKSSALIVASMYDRVDMAKILLTKKATDVNYVNSSGFTALNYALSEAMKALLQSYIVSKPVEQPAKVEKKVSTVNIKEFSWNKHINSKRLFKVIEDVGVNQKDKNGNDILSLATSLEKTDIVKVLITYPNIEPNSFNVGGYTPLQTAVIRKNKILVDLIANNSKVNINIPTSSGTNNTALILAVVNYSEPIIDILISKSYLDVNVMNKAGRTALSILAKNGELTMAKAIIDCKSYIHEVNMEAAKKNGVPQSTLDQLDSYYSK